MKAIIKNSTLLVILLHLILIKPIQAQASYNYVKVCKWEGITKNNQRIFGVTPTIDAAIAIIDRYNKKHQDTYTEIIYYAYTTQSVKHLGTTSFFKDFKNQNPKRYITFSLVEQQAIRIYTNESLVRAITYYSRAKDISYAAAHEHIEKLILKDCPYKLNFRLNLKSILF